MEFISPLRRGLSTASTGREGMEGDFCGHSNWRQVPYSLSVAPRGRNVRWKQHGDTHSRQPATPVSKAHSVHPSRAGERAQALRPWRGPRWSKGASNSNTPRGHAWASVSRSASGATPASCGAGGGGRLTSGFPRGFRGKTGLPDGGRLGPRAEIAPRPRPRGGPRAHRRNEPPAPGSEGGSGALDRDSG
jgi:hypothetical protein